MSSPPHLVIISGMSGAGRSAAAKALEDLGFFVIDNLPADLISDVVARADLREGGRKRVAAVVDTRGGLEFGDLEAVIRRLGAEGVVTTLLFLDADDEVLATRFEETRRPHPVPGETVAESIAAERAALRGLRGRADVIIDTSDRNVHELRDAVIEAFSGASDLRPLRVSVMSFGFKHGVPRVVDLLFDTRFLDNPHWEDGLRPLTGLDAEVRTFVLGTPDAVEFMDRTAGLLEFLIPRYSAEGKAYLTVAIGCTGGRHRSVVIAEELARRLRDLGGIEVSTRHRDIAR
ncbi:MAG: RNase adapter RapZ [Acidimicrobiia bacterium]|nr:RNase adapter RapZ [Acidimicrobiia bacterium]